MDQGMITIIVTIITTLGGAKAWEFYRAKLEIERDEEVDSKKEFTLFRDDLRERVAVLEERLEESRNDKQSLLESMTELKMTIAEFKTRIEFLEKSVSDKDKIIEELKIENKVLKDQLGKKE